MIVIRPGQRIISIGGPQFTMPRGAAALAYLLNAPFTGSDQGYANGQVLDTAAEGVTAGSLTVVEVDGTLALVSNKCTFTAQSTPVWGDLGLYSQAITRTLGLGLLASVSNDATKKGMALAWHYQTGVPNPSLTIYGLVFDASGTALAARDLYDSTIVIGAYAAATEYQFCLVLGGYDVNGVPWRSGQAAADYLYGASWYIEGGAYAMWTLLWRNAAANTSPLYAMLTTYNAAGTIDAFRVPDTSLSAVLQPTCLSTFTADNGVSLDAITPEVGGAWTEQAGNWDIQSSKARCADTGNDHYNATVNAAAASVMADASVTMGTGTNAIGGLCVRLQDAANCWFVNAFRSGQFRISELVAGGSTTRTSANLTIDGGQTCAIRAICYGTTIDAFLDGGNKISYGSASNFLTETKHGVMEYRSTTTYSENQFDNFACFARTSAVYDAAFDAV